jgi:hypothetical protein
MFEKTLKIELSPIPQAYHLNGHPKEIGGNSDAEI